MPFLSEEEVDELNNKIESLKENHSSITNLNDEYRKEIKQKNNQQRGLITACVVLFLGLIASLLFGFVFTDTKAPQTTTKTLEPIVVRDTFFIEKEIIKEVKANQNTTSEAYYGVQLAAYRKFDAEFTSDIQKIYKNNLIYYVLGHFTTSKEAENFRLILIDLKVKGTIVVKIKDGHFVD